MNEENENLTPPIDGDPDQEDMGAIKVADEVLSIVAGLAASEVTGDYGMSGGIREGLTDMLGKQNFSKGIKVYTEGHTVRVEVHVIITYGYNIPDVAIKLQEKVKEAVENMTGYEVTGVDVHVDTDELVKKWEEPPAEPAALPESAEGAAKENSTEAPAPQQEAPAPQAAATPETEKAKTAEGGTPEVEP